MTRRAGRLPGPHEAALLGLGLLHAVLLTIAFPPFGGWAASLVALCPLVVAARLVRSPWRGALWVALGTVPFWAFEHRWMFGVTPLGTPMLVVYLSCCTGLFVWFLARVAPSRQPGMVFVRAAAVPVVWAGLEYFRGRYGLGAYPWYLLGQPIIEQPALAAAGAVVGVTGVSVLVALPAGSVSLWMDGRKGTSAGWLIGSAALWAVLSALGFRSLDATASETLRVGIVQTNVPQDNRLVWRVDQRVRDFQDFINLTNQLVQEHPDLDLVVWPEAMFPGDTLDPTSLEAQRSARLAWNVTDPSGEPAQIPATELADSLITLQRRWGVPMLVGQDAFTNIRFEINDDGFVDYAFDARFNSVMMIRDGAVEPERYDKMQLTPYGEVMPGISAWPWLENRLLALGARGMRFDLEPGSRPTVFTLKTSGERPARVIAPICFEATLPHIGLRLARGPEGRRADAMVNVTNDGWFGRFAGGREQHELAARWRCVELGLPLVRVANTGISSVSDVRGRVVASLPPRQAGVLRVDIPLPSAEAMTFYSRHAPPVGLIALVGTALLLIRVLSKAKGSVGRDTQGTPACEPASPAGVPPPNDA